MLSFVGMYHSKHESPNMSKHLSICLILFALTLAGCKEKQTPVDPAEDEVITTVTLSLRDLSSNVVSEFVWEDLDGVGGNAPNRIDTLRLISSRMYLGGITIKNASVTPVVDLTPDIVAYKDQHQFFFSATNALAAVLTLDKDSRGLPVGLEFNVDAGTPGSGAFTVALSHYPTRTAKNGTTPSDETDISVTFPLVVE